MALSTWTIIGERINPGFKSTKELFEKQDIVGIQELARRQAKAGAAYLNVNTGVVGERNPEFAAEVVRAIQAVVDVPLSFDSASMALQELYLKTFDSGRAQGRKPMINSIAETRAEMLELLKIRPCKLIVMASERLENGAGRRNTKSEDVVGVAKRMVAGTDARGVPHDDIVVDVSISAMAADSEGLIRMALDAIREIGSLPELKGVHIMGGLSNIGQQLPAKAADGSDLKSKLECAFLTVATPLGFDTLLATPWKEYRLLPEDDFVLRQFKEFITLQGMPALRQLRKLYRV
jgi:5-methyltetrahydrofolate--homocysteine methyltransferase